MAYWTDEGAPCDVCGNWTRRHCNCGQALCAACGREFAGVPPVPHRDMMLGTCEATPSPRADSGACPRCGHKAHPETPIECQWCPEGYCETPAGQECQARHCPPSAHVDCEWPRCAGDQQ